MPVEQFSDLDFQNSVQMHFLKSPSPAFYEWLARQFTFKAEKMREELKRASNPGEAEHG